MSQPFIDVTPVDPSTGAMAAVVENRVLNIARSANVVNVKSHGATGDGSTDDTQCLKDAITAAGIGGVVFLPQGKYVVSSTVTMLADQKLVSTSMGSNQRYAEITSMVTSGPTIVMGNSSTIEALRITNNTSSIITGTSGISASQGVSMLTLRDVHVYGFDSGIYLSSIWYAHIERVHSQRNNWGLVLDYCYNANITSIRVYATTLDNVARGGIWLKNKAMASLHSGSIEGYQTGIQLDSNTHLSVFGTYFETTNGKNANGILFNGKFANVYLVGCEVYLSNQRWVNIPAACGSTLISQGHKFKGGTKDTTWEMAYYWDSPNAAALRMDLGRDSWYDVTAGIPYRRNDVDLPTGSTCVDPYGAATGGTDHLDGTSYLAGSLEMTNSSSVLGLPSGTAWPNMSAMSGRVGACFYRTDLKKVGFWSGTGWLDAMGTAIA